MKYLISFIFISLISGSILNAQSHNLNRFDEIIVASGLNVKIVKSDHVGYDIKGYNNIKDRLDISVRNGKLTVKIFRPWKDWYGNEKNGLITVYTNRMGSVIQSGSGKVYSDEEWSSKKMSLINSGSGSIKMNISAEDSSVNNSGSGMIEFKGVYDNISVINSGSGRVTGEGYAKSTSASQSGSGRIDLSELETLDSNNKISGSGIIAVNTKKSANYLISGSGSVKENGEPAHYKETISGSGRVN